MGLKNAVLRHLEKKTGVVLASAAHLNKITSRGQEARVQADRYAAYLKLVAAVPEAVAHQMAVMASNPNTQSQLGQELFVLLETGFKRNGYFVEFGAADGVFLSNSYLLETEFAWQGILAEPARSWHGLLRQSRVSNVDHRCVWSKSGENLAFNETSEAEYSTVASLNDNDQHSVRRKNGKTYSVPTVSLNDLLRDHDAPKSPDYLSIDTEGSELDILSELDFDRYRFKIITCEHNRTPQREKIFDLLTSKGYVRKFEELSQWDDWYLLA